MRLGASIPDRYAAAVKRMAVLIFVAVLQLNVVAAASDNTHFDGVAPTYAQGTKCGGADGHDAPIQTRCRHIQCCILGAADGASLGRAIVSALIAPDLQYAGDALARLFSRIVEPANSVVPQKAGSPRSPPAAA